jgi:hypothetical protein
LLERRVTGRDAPVRGMIQHFLDVEEEDTVLGWGIDDVST